MKTIIITGASSGIGSAVAQRFLREDWQVGLLARGEVALREVAGDHRSAVVLPCDVAIPDQVESAFASFAEKAAGSAYCSNNAGIFTPANRHRRDIPSRTGRAR